MLSGGHVHRHAVSTLVEASFCAQVEGNKCTGRVLQFDMEPLSPCDEVSEQVPVGSRRSRAFDPVDVLALVWRQVRFWLRSSSLACIDRLRGSARTFHSQHACLSVSTARSRSNSSFSGVDVPLIYASEDLTGPLSQATRSSTFSIDLGNLKTILTKVTRPTSSVARAYARPRARDTAHGRRTEQVRMSHS